MSGRHSLQQWRDEGILEDDEHPPFTLYRMVFTDDAERSPVDRRRHRSAEGDTRRRGTAPGDGVLPHERTTPKARWTGRLTCCATRQPSPIWGLSLARGLTALLLDGRRRVPTTTCAHRRAHRPSPSGAGPIGAVGSFPVLIADGHHPLRREPAVPRGTTGAEMAAWRVLAHLHHDVPRRTGGGPVEVAPSTGCSTAAAGGPARGSDALVRHRAPGRPPPSWRPRGGARRVAYVGPRRQPPWLRPASRLFNGVPATSIRPVWSTRWSTCPTSCATSPRCPGLAGAGCGRCPGGCPRPPRERGRDRADGLVKAARRAAQVDVLHPEAHRTSSSGPTRG